LPPADRGGAVAKSADDKDPLVALGRLPKHGYPVQQTTLDVLANAARLRQDAGHPPVWLWHLRRALLPNRDGYTCQYCGRNAWDALFELGRTLRFEVDHKIAASRLADRYAFDVANMVMACRSCKVIKSQMELQPFYSELRSLARAIVRRNESDWQLQQPGSAGR
jgi:5-methylcytosine-specific restriction endonuclease McrA